MKTTSSDVDIPQCVVGRYNPSKWPVQYCAHMTAVKYHYIAFDREALRVHLSRHLAAFGQSDDLFQASGKAKDFMELGPDECGTSRTVQ